MKGIIVAWSGQISDIDTKNWGFCDGTLYTALDGTKLQSPDLRSKFIVGASKPNASTNGYVDGWGPNGQPSYPGMPLVPRQVGNQGGEENHTLTVNEMPSHSHNFPGGPFYPGWTSGNGGGNDWAVQTRNTEATGGSASHNNMPPFYALAYIIKL